METKGKILVIDDELGIRQGCRRALEPQGFSVELASTLQEGMDIISRDTFDLVLLDIMMPDGRGIDLLDPIHKKDPETVCVIITGYATVELAVNAIKHGAYDFISKPFTSDLLLMTVNQGLEKRRLSAEAKQLQEVEKKAAQLAQAKEEMERIDQAKSTFMLTIAHELRSPVSGAQSLMRTLTRGLAGELNDQQNEILKRIEVRFDMLMELINDILSLASSKSFQLDEPLEQVGLNPFLREVIDHFSDIAQSKDISLTLEMPESVIEIQGTADGLEKIFSNLVGNAIKYTPEGGRVHVTVIKSSKDVEITVEDSGIGIPAEDIPHLWDEFFRARNARHSGITGTGLGLSIVKQLVDRFGGAISVESTEGKGSKFILSLPNYSASTLDT